jgi:DNA-binding PadR family transcriptional regulator
LSKKDEFSKYLPLSESTYYILLALVEPLHGYAVMQKVEILSNGLVTIGPGTLYGAFTILETEKLIIKVSEIDRRKTYSLTPKGKTILLRQIERVEMMLKNGVQVKNFLE